MTVASPTSERTGRGADEAPAHDEIIPVRHPGRWVAVVVIAVLFAMLVHSLVTDPRYQWSIVGQYFGSGLMLRGLSLTLELTALSMLIGIAVGVIVAVLRLSPNPILAKGSALYIWFFRGTPVLVQLIFWYNIAALYPRVSIGVPFGPTIVGGSTNSIITPIAAALLGLGLNEGAYMSEIVRAGILSVERGQIDAASALGLSRLKTMKGIVLPQAMRVIIPPTGNETIGMLKTTSLVSVLSLAELLYSAEIVYERTFQTIPLLIVASLWYLIVTTVLTIGQMRIESYFGRSVGTPWAEGRKTARDYLRGALRFHADVRELLTLGRRPQAPAELPGSRRR